MLKKVNKPVTIIGLSLLFLFSGIIIVWPQQTAHFIDVFYKFMTRDLAWLFMGSGAAFAIFALFIAFSKYGDIKIGGKDAKPHYTSFAWNSMIITSCLAIGILTFGMIEWAYYVNESPFGVTPGSVRSYELASAYGMFHWGPIAWTFYLIPAFSIGYMYWNKKSKSLAMSDLCSGVLTEDRNKYKALRWAIDGIIAFCFVGSMASTVGLGTPIIVELLSRLLNIPTSFGLQMGVTLAFGIFFLASVSKNISKGMQWISTNNVKLCILFFIYVFICSPNKSFVLNNLTMAIGTNITETVRMAFFTDAIGNTGFAQSWTVFYWSWYVGLAISCGTWIARISYGRTLKEIIMTTCIWTPLASWVTYGILGNYSMSLQLSGVYKLADKIGGLTTAGAVAETLSTLPLAGLVFVVYIILMFFNLGTTCTAHSTSVSILTSKDISGNEEPSSSWKLMWGFMFLAIPIGVMFLEKNVPGLNLLKTLQSITLIFAIPIVFVAVLLACSAYKVFKNDIAKGNIPVEEKNLYKWTNN
ncbi:BCCT family transporter [Abyssisolibacter fermentans]|uniref:BCCT family transporter n=1 Tax=Abyssisolibacter fermentans TaxID=1766203 RepID=UPI00082BC226|nr:BCCT family transporter [Abyssisolibacter fermentans]